MPPSDVYDVPIAIHIAKSTNIAYMVTRNAQVYLFDIFSAKMICCERVARDIVCATCRHVDTDGIFVLTKSNGHLLHIGFDEDLVVSHITDSLCDNELALDIARRMKHTGNAQVYISKFNALINEGDVTGAVQFVINAPNGMLRTPETLQRFAQTPGICGQIEPVLQYFAALLNHGELNHFETLEVVRRTLMARRYDLIKNWITANKLKLSEALGDLLFGADHELALQVYLRLGATEKVIEGFLKLGDVDQLIRHISTLKCDWSAELKKCVSAYPAKTAELALQLVKKEWGGCIDCQTCREIILAARELGHHVEFPACGDDSDPFFGLPYVSSNINCTPSSVSVTDAPTVTTPQYSSATVQSVTVNSSPHTIANSPPAIPSVPIILSADITIDTSACISSTSFSSVYRGKYHNTDVAIKVLRRGRLHHRGQIDCHRC